MDNSLTAKANENPSSTPEKFPKMVWEDDGLNVVDGLYTMYLVDQDGGKKAFATMWAHKSFTSVSFSFSCSARIEREPNETIEDTKVKVEKLIPWQRESSLMPWIEKSVVWRKS